MFKVLPAHAGMIPNVDYIGMELQSAPRTCGDDPFWNVLRKTKRPCSPHMRG